MRYQITTGWPIGSWFIPSGTIIDTTKAEAQRTREETWALGRMPPRDAIALDDETYAAMRKAYEGPAGGSWRVHRRY
jgi:hypothetical protein